MKIFTSIFITLVLYLVGSSIVNADDGTTIDMTDNVFTDLSWTPALTRIDGSDLSINEIGGYRIYASNTATTPPVLLVDIGDNTQTTYTFGYTLPVSLSQYDYYYAVTQYDIQGLESAFSEVVTKSFLVSSTVAPGNPSGFGAIIRAGNGYVVTEVLIP